MSIRDMEMLGIGKPNDVGGTETEGTVMAKENAILKKMAGLAADNTELREMVLRSGNSILGKFLTNPKAILSAASEEGKGAKTSKITLEKPAWLFYFQASSAQGLTCNVTCKINGVVIMSVNYSGTNSVPSAYITNNVRDGWSTSGAFSTFSLTANYPYLEAGSEIELTVSPSGTSSVTSKNVSASMYICEEVPGLETMQAALDYLTMMAE